MAEALQIHNSALHQAVESNGGVVFKVVGDSFQAAFDTAMQALKAAIAGQQALQNALWNELGALKVRMGLHTGEAELDPHSDEYIISHTKNRVARIMSIAHGGQVLLSQETADLVMRNLPDGVTLKDLGEHRLKGMLLPEHLFQVSAPGLPGGFPPLVSEKEPVSNLPPQLTSFIGRQKEIENLQAMIEQHRLVTLTGVGGVGKTRLALKVAGMMTTRFSRGAWLVELAPLGDPQVIPHAIAAVFSLRPDRNRSIREVLFDYLRDKHLLLILDNCEHLIDACAELAETILLACPQVHILASSREALGIAGEISYPLPSLALPDMSSSTSLPSLSSYEAVQLFNERAQAIVPGFVLTDANITGVVRICQRVDGIPLAIELVVARLQMLSIEQILSRLETDFRLLAGSSRRHLPRHQTLQALIGWSYKLLTEREQAVFRRLSVFSGGWTLEAAEQVCVVTTSETSPEGSYGTGKLDVLGLLTQLVNKSLVIVQREAGEVVRYRMLETIRQYAQERLIESGEAPTVRDRHLEHYMHFAEISEKRLETRERLACLEQLRIEIDNLRVAMGWSQDSEQTERVVAGLRLAGALYWLWHCDGYHAEARAWLEKGLEMLGKADSRYTSVRVRAAFAISYLGFFQADNKTIQYLKDNMAITRQTGDSLGYALAELLLADWIYYAEIDDPNVALTLLEDCIGKLRTVGDKFWLATALCLRSWIWTYLIYNEAAALEDSAEGLALLEELGNRWDAGFWKGNLVEFHLLRGNLDQAQELAEERLQLMNEEKDKIGIGIAFDLLGRIARRRGDFQQMEKFYQGSYEICKEFGNKFDQVHTPRLIGVAALGQGDIQQAARKFKEFIPRARALGDRMGLVTCLVHGAGVALALRQPARATRCLAVVDTLLVVDQKKLYIDEQLDYDRYLADCRSQLEAATFEAAWGEGQRMTLDEALADAQAFYGGISAGQFA